MNLEEHVRAAIENERHRVRRKLIYALLLLAAVYIIAIFSFHYTEGWTWEDSTYFTTSTITTVGYGDLTPKTYMGRMITIPLMFIGIGVGLYAIYAIQDYGKANLEEVAQHIDNRISGRHKKK
jgi:peptidoglycan/LPS O-acetylase OafA/YrhL